jgi:ATP-dependent helicase IRC3
VDMINEKWLSDVIFTTVRMKKTNLEKVATGANGDFLTSALSEAVNTPENNEMAVRSWLSRCALRRSTLAFCVDIKHVVDLAAAFQACGIESRIVTGDTPKQVRGATVDAFRRGEFPVLLNCGVFTEGTDIPNIDCILLARPTKSRNLLVQMIGRGMRLHAAKTNCHVIDMVSSLKTGIVTTPTLYGLDPDELVESARVEDLQNLKDRQERAKLAIQELQTAKTVAPAMLQGESSKMISFVDYDSINDLIEDTSGERHIRAISPHAWVQVNEDDYVLTTSFGNVLRITKDDHYRVKYTAKLPASEQKKSPYARPRMIIEKALTFEDAIHGADSFAEQVFPFVFIDKNQRWRRDDATAAQLDYLNKFRPEDKQLDTCSITKGRAVDMITKLKFGARGRFDRIEASRARAKKQDSTMRKMEEMKSREQVRVGPLEP